MTRDWGFVYQGQSFSKDAVLFTLAALLHLPLLGLHMRAPVPGEKGRIDRLVNIDYIEIKAKERKQQKDEAAAEAARKAEEAARKAAEVRAKLMAKAVLPPAPVLPKPAVKPEIKMADPSKITMDIKRQLELKTQQLKSDKNFTDKPGQLPTAPGANKINLGGGVTAINMGNKAGAAPGLPDGPALKGKSGNFAMSSKSAPVGIGGGDEGIKMGGSAAIVVPVSSRARADSNILSSVATISDKGSLKGGGGAPGGVPGGTGGSAGLALGPGGQGGGIAVTGSRGTPVALPSAPAVSSGKSFSDKTASASGGASAGGGIRSTGAALPTVGAIARRPAQARSLFQITGPLEKRPIVSRVVPTYPDWARSKGITATVTVQITVMADGVVRTNMIVVRTSGYPDMDALVMDALRQTRFAPLPPDQNNRDEVGNVSFTFTI